jgi:hypothetical protein
MKKRFLSFLLSKSSSDQQHQGKEKESRLLLLANDEHLEAVIMVYGLLLMQRCVDKYSNMSEGTNKQNKVIALSVSFPSLLSIPLLYLSC